MKIIVELYGASRDFSNEGSIQIELKKNSCIKDLRNELIKFIEKKHKGNKNFYQIAISSAFCLENNNIVNDDYSISKEQKIAIIPPIAGG
tara:strand:- start:985 stop:1254 length:270 start_codon:yes stop_codon:yes gene_type:complete